MNLKNIIISSFCFSFFLFSAFASNRDSTFIKSQVIGLGGSAFRFPIGKDVNGNYKEYHLYKVKADYGFVISPFFLFKSGLTYANSNQIFSFRKHMLNVDLMGIFYWRFLHLDAGFHCGTYTESAPPFNLSSSPLAQFISLGIGITIPIGNRWSFDLNYRRSYNVTFKQNSYGDILDGYIGAQYAIKGNNKYLRKKSQV